MTTKHAYFRERRWWLLGLWLLAPMAFALPQMLDIRYQNLQPGLSEFEILFDDLVGEPESEFAINPAQLTLRFSDAISSLALAEIPIADQGVEKITQSNRNGQAEVVFHLTEPMAYAGEIDGRRYRIQLSRDGDRLVQPKSESKAGVISRIEAIDFRRGPEGEGVLQIHLDSPRSAFDIAQKGERLELEFFNSLILEQLVYRLDVMDFATPVAAVETFREQQNVRFVVEPSADYTYDFYQSGKILTVLFKPGTGEPQSVLQESFSGDAISLNFQDIPVRTVLQILADYNGFNLVASDTVAGNVTLRLDQVPWDQALSIILKAKGLDKREQGNVVLIAPAEELAAREAQELKNAQQVESLRPLYSEFIQINYAKATEIASLLKNAESNLLSERGNITVDARTNTLLVQDTRDKLNELRSLIQVLDVPVRQVLIEARMVTVKENVGREFGLRFGTTQNGGEWATSGGLEGADTAMGGGTPSLGDRLNVDLPVAGATGTLGFVTKLADGILLDLELSALERENEGEVIASPRLTTANQKAAHIEQGVEIPYVQATSSGATSVTFKKAVLSLRVTPQITPDNRVILDLVVNQDTRGDTVKTGTGDAVAIDTQEISTQVLVNNGQTIVLGGIYQQNAGQAVSKVPLLGDLPFVGKVFRNTSRYNDKSEVLIFVTPRIIDDAMWQELAPENGWSRAAQDVPPLTKAAAEPITEAEAGTLPRLTLQEENQLAQGQVLFIDDSEAELLAPASPATGWVVQLLATNVYTKAEKLILNYPDIPLLIETVRNNTLHQVFLDGFTTRQAAEQASAALPAPLQALRPWIRPARS